MRFEFMAVQRGAGSRVSQSLLRRNPDGTVAYVALPYKKMIHGQSANVQLHATDIVYVPTSMFKLIYGSFQGVIDSAVTTSIYYAEFR